MNYVKCIKNVLAKTNKILNQTFNIHIKNYPVDVSSKKMKFKFPYLIRKYSIF